MIWVKVGHAPDLKPFFELENDHGRMAHARPEFYDGSFPSWMGLLKLGMIKN